jgi:bacteriocin-like protein
MTWFAYDPNEKEEELSDEDLDNVSGGTDPTTGKPK